MDVKLFISQQNQLIFLSNTKSHSHQLFLYIKTSTLLTINFKQLKQLKYQLPTFKVKLIELPREYTNLILSILISTMYNIHMVTKIKKELKKQRLNHIKEKQYIQNYSHQVQPKLLDNYNKRMNIFLRKMEQHPVIIKQSTHNQGSPDNIFRNFNYNKQKCLGSEVFHFRDKNDWNSLYTPAERTQKKNNQKFMKQKFGDATLAYRSIASDSLYMTAYKHEYRLRNKEKEINPPMKYVCAVPKIMIKKLNDKANIYRMKTQGHQETSKQKKHLNHIDLRKNKSLLNKNLHDDDNKSVRSVGTIRSISSETNFKNDQQNQTNEDTIQEQKDRKSKQYISDKLHFKTLTESFNLCKDTKFKQNLKQVLLKCNVFRNKDPKGIQQTEVDKLALGFDGGPASSNNIETKRNFMK